MKYLIFVGTYLLVGLITMVIMRLVGKEKQSLWLWVGVVTLFPYIWFILLEEGWLKFKMWFKYHWGRFVDWGENIKF